MCLLDEVIDWAPEHIRCRSTTHRSPTNPLRANGRLGIATGIEYAAQAMAVHGALRAGSAGTALRPGLLASTRGVQLGAARLDDLTDDLIAVATYVNGDAAMVLYDFTVSAGARVLLRGRATIAFASPGAAPGAA